MNIDRDDRIKAGGLSGVVTSFQVSPSGTRACALVTKGIICLDTSTMTEAGRQENFKNLDMIVFEKP
jgi:hypothetical protein